MTIRMPPPLEHDSADNLQIDTPVIDIQDLEHQPSMQTRVNNAGVEVLPQLDLSREDEKARKAIEEFEEQTKRQPPG